MLDPMHPIATNSDSFQTAHAMLAFIAIFVGAVVSYLWRILNGLKFSILNMIVYMSMSGFAGFICWLLCQHFKVDPAMTAACSGLAGHMGAQFIAILEKRLVSTVEVDNSPILPDGESK